MQEIKVSFIHPFNNVSIIKVDLDPLITASDALQALIDSNSIPNVSKSYELKTENGYIIPPDQNLFQHGVVDGSELRIEVGSSDPVTHHKKKSLLLAVLLSFILMGCGYYCFVFNSSSPTPTPTPTPSPTPIITDDDDQEPAPPFATEGKEELRQALLKIGNSNIEFSDRFASIEGVMDDYFSPQARIKQVGENGTVTNIHNANDYLQYLASIITLTDIEIINVKMSKQSGKYWILELYEEHQYN